ncbi:hypothetical protein [Amycolatopsis sp.]|jgi:hypothetical protein|uniref:hypothetical protein n=1 Tax=Amycolatopsis sp. TaxID=37632 RepID=UPI0026236B9D|nr:hypothetical protein [Amycolatopsis sp.]
MGLHHRTSDSCAAARTGCTSAHELISAFFGPERTAIAEWIQEEESWFVHRFGGDLDADDFDELAATAVV